MPTVCGNLRSSCCLPYDYCIEVEAEFLSRVNNIGTHPLAMSLLRSHFIPSLYLHPLPALPDESSPLYNIAYEHSSIGWGLCMCRGRVSKRWQELHTDRRWSKRFVHILLTLGLRLWKMQLYP